MIETEINVNHDFFSFFFFTVIPNLFGKPLVTFVNTLNYIVFISKVIYT